ncbi:MAG: T9SS type A sorting domain-containing protein [Ignavibacteriae bacterium]|nr:T9SS type A sorting domain-containing protein [Ignavibacteriota bacterium]
MQIICLRLLRSGEEPSGSRVLDVDVAGLRAGLYFVRVTGRQATQTVKLLIR